jgi:hypothetical protein
MAISTIGGVTAAAGKIPYVTTITSTQSWTVPTGVTQLELFLVGGGGGASGGGYDGNYSWFSAGGGGAQVLERVVDVTSGSSYTITIGAGGAGGASNNSSGQSFASQGGTSSFGTLAYAYGGGLGGGAANSVNSRNSTTPTTQVGSAGGTQVQNYNNMVRTGGGGGAGGPAGGPAGGLNTGSWGATNYQNGYYYGSPGGIAICTASDNVGTPNIPGPGIKGYAGGGAGSVYGNNGGSNPPAWGRDGGGHGSGYYNSSWIDGTAGLANTGGGGGASTGGTGKSGGSGICIIRYWA